MNKMVKLFIATTELYQSPMVAALRTSCDAALILGEEQSITITLPECTPDARIEVSYNPHMIELSDAKIVTSRHRPGLLLTIRGRSRELGHTFLTIFTTQKEQLQKDRSVSYRSAILAGVH